MNYFKSHLPMRVCGIVVTVFVAGCGQEPKLAHVAASESEKSGQTETDKREPTNLSDVRLRSPLLNELHKLYITRCSESYWNDPRLHGYPIGIKTTQEELDREAKNITRYSQYIAGHLKNADAGDCQSWIALCGEVWRERQAPVLCTGLFMLTSNIQGCWRIKDDHSSESESGGEAVES